MKNVNPPIITFCELESDEVDVGETDGFDVGEADGAVGLLVGTSIEDLETEFGTKQ